MAIRVGFGLVMLGLLSGGCYGTDAQAKDGQSHWLTACTSDGDCSSGELCACGVCTEPCDATATCGAASSCEATVSRSQCAAVTDAIERVCLASCNNDEGCGPELQCEDGACVAASDEVPDAALRDDAGTAPDAAVPAEVDAAVPAYEEGVSEILGPEIDGFGTSTGVSTFQLIDGAVIWMTTDVAPTPDVEPENAYLYRMDLEDRSVERLDGPFSVPALPRIAVDGGYVFYSTREGINVHQLGQPGTAWSNERDEVHRAVWLLDQGYYYFTTSAVPNEVWRMTYEAGLEELVFDGGEGVVVRGLAADADNLYVETHEPLASVMTRVQQMTKTGANVATLIDELRGTELPSDVLIPEGFFASDGFLISDEDGHTGVQAHSIATGERRVMASASTSGSSLVACSANGGYVYYAGQVRQGDVTERFVARSSLVSGETERLHTGVSKPVQIMADADYVYWSESGRLLRKSLPQR